MTIVVIIAELIVH